MSPRGAPLPPCQFSLCPGLLLLRVPVGMCPASQLLLAPGLLYMFCMCILQPELTISHFHSRLQPCAPSCAGLFPPRTCAILEAPATADLLDGCSMELGSSESHTCLVPTNKREGWTGPEHPPGSQLRNYLLHPLLGRRAQPAGCVGDHAGRRHLWTLAVMAGRRLWAQLDVDSNTGERPWTLLDKARAFAGLWSHISS